MDEDNPKNKVPQDDRGVQIKIPETAGSVSVEDVKKDTDSKFKEVNFILYGVVLILIVMVATLIIDSFHINSVTYKEYSEKIDERDQILKTNQALLDENTKLQKIIETQSEIMNMSRQ